MTLIAATLLISAPMWFGTTQAPTATTKRQTASSLSVAELLRVMAGCRDVEVAGVLTSGSMRQAEEGSEPEAPSSGAGRSDGREANVAFLKEDLGGLQGFCAAASKALRLGVSPVGSGWCAPRRSCEDDALYVEREPHAWIVNGRVSATHRTGKRRVLGRQGHLVKMCPRQPAYDPRATTVCVLLGDEAWFVPAWAVFTRDEPLVHLAVEDGKLVITRLVTPD